MSRSAFCDALQGEQQADPNAAAALLPVAQVSLIRYFLVHAVKAQQMEEVRSFFMDYGDLLMAGPEASEWSAWFALPYVHAPAAHPSFKARMCPFPTP